MAGLVAKRHARMNVITASVDNLKFLQGAYVGNTVVIIGKVTCRQNLHGSQSGYLCGR